MFPCWWKKYLFNQGTFTVVKLSLVKKYYYLLLQKTKKQSLDVFHPNRRWTLVSPAPPKLLLGFSLIFTFQFSKLGIISDFKRFFHLLKYYTMIWFMFLNKSEVQFQKQNGPRVARPCVNCQKQCATQI